MAYKYIIYKPGKVARVILNRPQNYNAISYRMFEEVDDAFSRAEADKQVRVIVISGAGPCFSGGHDLGTPEFVAEREYEFGAVGYEERQWADERQYKLDYKLRLRNNKKPTIAMVHGYCIYGGWMLAAAMDIIFAAEEALFLFAFGQYATLPWDIGPRKAKEILFEHRFVPGREACELGLVNRVFPRDRLEEETLAYAERVADWVDTDPIIDVSRGKAIINHTMDAMGYTTELQAAFDMYYLAISNKNPTCAIPERPAEEIARDGKGVAQVPRALRNLKLKLESEDRTKKKAKR
ncbi:enoyl-CoA hydratase-related protein [Chloroflexota bacterium]